MLAVIAALVLVMCLSIGVVVVRYANRFKERMWRKAFISIQAGGLIGLVGALKALREGRSQDCMSILEGIIDCTIITMQEFRDQDSDKNVSSIMSVLNSYRTRFPRESGDKDIDCLVRKLISEMSE